MNEQQNKEQSYDLGPYFGPLEMFKCGPFMDFRSIFHHVYPLYITASSLLVFLYISGIPVVIWTRLRSIVHLLQPVYHCKTVPCIFAIYQLRFDLIYKGFWALAHFHLIPCQPPLLRWICSFHFFIHHILAYIILNFKGIDGIFTKKEGF